MTTPNTLIKVVDFFSGCGGTSCGFKDAGLDIVLGLDCDADSGGTFSKNLASSAFKQVDLQTLDPSKLFNETVQPLDGVVLFSGCAPCQPFTKQRTHKTSIDSRRTLLNTFGRFVDYWRPDLVFVENVPGLQKIGARSGPFSKFLRLLRASGYWVSHGVVAACDYGVPQRRQRLILMASRLGPIELPAPTHGPVSGRPYTSVREWISALPAISAGEISAGDADHQAAALNNLNLQRIRATPEGGGRQSWPVELLTPCHEGHSGHSDVYGRLSWGQLASALTTRCISYSNGRFGHPEQDRAISLREAACLQTFPRNWIFDGSLESRARQVGNAVPPAMAKAVGTAFLQHALKFSPSRRLVA